MRTEIIEVSNEHFEWASDEEGNPVKKKVSDQIFIDKILITYNDEGEEISREGYVEPQKVDLSNIDISTLTDEQIIQLKKRFGF